MIPGTVQILAFVPSASAVADQQRQFVQPAFSNQRPVINVIDHADELCISQLHELSWKTGVPGQWIIEQTLDLTAAPAGRRDASGFHCFRKPDDVFGDADPANNFSVYF